MIRGILHRLAGGAATLLLVLTIAFALLQLMPGDPSDVADDPSLSAADRARVTRALGLDKPPLQQFLTFIGNAARGDLGISLRYQEPVRRVLLTALGPTVLLTATALLIAFAVGLTIGTRAAVRSGGLSDRIVRFVLPVLDALPPFWIGLIAIYVFAWKLGLLPASHMRSAGSTGGILDLIRHLALPALVLGLPSAAPVARHHAEAMRRELSSAYVQIARSMGLSATRVVWRALRNSMHPAITLLGLALPATVGGAVVVEVVFSWPGLGQVHQQALLARDLPLALGGLALVAAMVIVGGIASDLLSSLIDPRWRDSR